MCEEANIIINGKTLDSRDSMTLRVALESFAMSLCSDDIGDDEHGQVMKKLYMQSVERIRVPLYGTKDD